MTDQPSRPENQSIIFSVTLRTGESFRINDLLGGGMRVVEIQTEEDDEVVTGFRLVTFEACPAPGCQGILINIGKLEAPECHCQTCGGRFRGGQMASRHISITRVVKAEDVAYYELANNDVLNWNDLISPPTEPEDEEVAEVPGVQVPAAQ
jgi:hypothetical protein